MMEYDSIDWFQGKIRGKSHISWEDLWFPVKIFPSTNPLNDGRCRDHDISGELAYLCKTPHFSWVNYRKSIHINGNV